ncbi:MAG: YggT family protein [Candidatus Izemoplasmatales bacterium]|uniref:YggT family protein n=1 Tax=Hujiaoplasma nucleasis TaxID=2725268 RepID=A0A7L6N2F4_9MOLU|nr:YggT family protein [Hujiaoplasma nucleasis]QLY39632.1 YggT family protein [Hujiaoplasma nucleasis]
MYDFLVIAYYLLTIYFYLMLAYIILSWTPLVNSKFYEMLTRIVHPYLGMFRGWLILGQIDFTPMFGLILFQFLLRFIAQALTG